MTAPVANEVTDTAGLEAVHRELLAPNFPEDELVDLDTFLADAASPATSVLTLRDETGRGVAVSVGAFDERSRVLLLVYLAVRPGIRGGGLGGRLLAASLERWQQRFGPDFVVGEVERPGDRAEAIEAHGDAAARLRFYSRFGALRVEAPFFQPRMHAATGRVPMHLMLLHVGDTVRRGELPGGGLLVAAGPLHDFVADYIAASEGTAPTDEQARSLLDALSGESVPAPPLL